MTDNLYTQSMLKENSLKDKVIVITGGGTGLGKSMGTYFSQLGANLIITSRKQERLEKTASKIYEKTKNKVLPLVCDVRDYKQV